MLLKLTIPATWVEIKGQLATGPIECEVESQEDARPDDDRRENRPSEKRDDHDKASSPLDLGSLADWLCQKPPECLLPKDLNFNDNTLRGHWAKTTGFSPEVLPTLSAVGLECLAQRPTDRNVLLATLSLGRTLFDGFPQLVREENPADVLHSVNCADFALDTSARFHAEEVRLDDLPALLAIKESPALCRALSLSTTGCYG